MIVAAMQFKIHQVVGDDTFLVFEASKFQHPSTLLNTSANYNIVLKYFEPIREGKPGNDGRESLVELSVFLCTTE